MSVHSPGWYRMRMAAIKQLAAISRVEKDTLLLRNGVIPKDGDIYYHDGYCSWASYPDQLYKHEKYINEEPLSFSEATRFNTWFNMHPGKVFGEEVATTSLAFPVTIKGNRATIETGFSHYIKKSNPQSSTVADLKLKALALALELELLKL